MAFPQVWGIALALNIPSLQVVLHGEKKKEEGKKKNSQIGVSQPILSNRDVLFLSCDSMTQNLYL